MPHRSYPKDTVPKGKLGFLLSLAENIFPLTCNFSRENKTGQYDDNTARYSGGQKAQFTYAILGAAIAHQFGIFQPGKQHKSLRFITVDEAFSKLDPEKSQFLMEFCAQLNLQILVVTPLDKINIAEPYIHAVHFVEIKNKKHSISVKNTYFVYF